MVLKGSKKFLVLSLIVVIVTAILVTVIITVSNQRKITSFAECVNAGYPVMESYPRQCKANDQIFTEIIEDSIIDTSNDYYGFSTEGFCEASTDCVIAGCNSEICKSQSEESLYSICTVPDKPVPSNLGYNCECISNQCVWNK